MSGSKKDPKDLEDFRDDEEGVRHSTARTEIKTDIGDFDPDLKQSAEKFDPSLQVIQGDLMGYVFRIKLGSSYIGRTPTSDIHLNQRFVSSKHAELKNDGQSVTLIDLNSANGTNVNGLRIGHPVVLKAGDLIKIGSYVLRYMDRQLDSQMAEYLHARGSIDGLTGVFNKEHILKQLKSSIDVAKSGHPLSLIVIDLDHFKKVNDTYGHAAGDFILKESVRVIKETALRHEDIMGRFGGEEFVVIMPDTNIKNAILVAERIRQSLQVHSFVFEGQKIPVTASIGVCDWNPRMKTPEDMFILADQLLYKSKQNGRNRVSHTLGNV